MTSLTLPVGDPRRAAWLQHWRRIGKADEAQAIERRREAVQVASHWPPQSPEVEFVDYGGGRGNWVIPPLTPEWASWVAHMRRSGRDGVAKGQAMEVSPRQITREARWAPVAIEGTGMTETKDAPKAQQAPPEAPSCCETFAADVDRVLVELGAMLKAKNANYGNSALEPVRVFSKADTIEQILVRIDDKLARSMRGHAAGEDVELDLLGYLVILRVARARAAASREGGR